jgi:acrylyl-CoA reductase (NADPH)
MSTIQPFSAFRIFNDAGTISGGIVQTTLDELSPGDVVIRAAYSSVNYKDALAGTGAGKILRRFPLIGGIDVAGTVESSDDPRFVRGQEVLVTGYDLGVAHDGGYSAFVRVPAQWVVPIPIGLSLLEAMTIGTAGFTAALSVVRLEQNGLTPKNGPVIVTGATGGVGSVGVAILAALGYHVVALTGKDQQRDHLISLGASEVLTRGTLAMGTKPLEKATWAGAVDPVGGEVLAWLTRTMLYGGSIACSGLTAGTELHTTVLPFILRSVNLLGIDSALCTMPVREVVWKRLATDMKGHVGRLHVQQIGFDGLDQAFATLLKGGAVGRYVVRLG